jgi:hypothetical protein
MDFHSFFANPATQTAINGLVGYAVAFAVKKSGANPRYAPYVAMIGGALGSAGQAATGNGPADFPTAALLAVMGGLLASGGHEAIKKAAGK